jgi:multiple sugar transport system permease protein
MTETTESLRTTPATPRRPDWMRRLQRPSVREAAWGFVFIGPWLIGLVLFTAGPMVVSFLMSMTDFDLVNPDRVKFVGIDNYVRMAGDPTVHQTLVATITFAAILIPVTMLASLAFAVFLNHPRLPGKGPLRALVYMPIMIPLVASTLVWIGFLNTETGWMNAILGNLGLPEPDWINSEVWVYPALSIIGLWAIGNFMIINIAGLQSVPTELYDAAKIDGAGAWASFRRITIPLMSPVLLYNLVICLIGTFQYFTQVYTMTNGRGDPNGATLFINLVLFREAFVFNHMGYGAAIAWLLFVIVLVLTLALFAFARNRVYYAGDDR